MGTVIRFPTRVPPGMVSPVNLGPVGSDPLLELMRRHGIELTRQNYTNMGEIEWTAEHEANLPAELRDWDALEAEHDANLPPVCDTDYPR